jgi:hypothetical protein
MGCDADFRSRSAESSVLDIHPVCLKVLVDTGNADGMLIQRYSATHLHSSGVSNIAQGFRFIGKKRRIDHGSKAE